MPPVFARLDHLHRASSVLSASTQRGLTVAPPTATDGNAGRLVPRVTGTPWGELDAILRVQTGGNPTGYGLPGVAGSSRGCAVAWKLDGDADTLYRGYTDTPYLVRVAHPIAYGTTHAPTSTPRQLADGYMGVFLATTTTAHRFYRIAANWSQSSALVSSLTLPGTGYRVDYCILPSGRLVAGVHAQGGQDGIQTYYSDDDGATWAALGYSAPGVGGAARDVLCMEAVGDDVVAILASSTGATTARILLSRDGGATFTSVDTSTTLLNPRTCVRDGVVLVAHRAATTVYVYPLAPGGGLGTPVATSAGCNGVAAIACRDDGVLVALGWEDGGGNNMAMDMSMSLDGGLTWADPAADPVLDLETAGYANNGIDALSAGVWQGQVIAIARADSALGSDGGLHFLVFGEWANVTDGFGGAVSPEVYQHSYIALGYPQEFGWTRTDFGGGATLANQPYLNIVSTGADNSDFRTSAALWTTAAGDSRKVRIRLRVNSGGSVTGDSSRFFLSMDDGANAQEVRLRVNTTTARLVDYTGATIGSDLTLDLTAWTDFIIAFAHDSPAAGAGRISIWYKQDADATYTSWHSNVNVPENAGSLLDRLVFGGNTGGAANWDIAYIGISESVEGMADGFTSPADLSPRCLSAGFDLFVSRGVNLGGRGFGAVPGDTYAIGTEYARGKANAWREFRPSRRVESSADKTAWNIVFDATANDKFRGDLVALFGTNFRTATFQMNTADSWASPAVSIALDATAWSGTRSTSGPGFVLVTGTPNWRQGQWRSDGDAHRWFVEVDLGGTSTVYEVTDNDESRIFVDGVDLSSVTGAVYIFGDRMATPIPWSQYRFARVLVGSQDTADGYYFLGTPVIATAFQPARSYDENYTDRVEPSVVSFDADGGQSVRARLGPRRYSVSVQWPLLNAIRHDVERRLRDFYAAVEGNLRPVVFWRDPRDVTTLMLVYVEGVYAAPNARGEGPDALARVDELALVECV